jgi:hypothetical protein
MFFVYYSFSIVFIKNLQIIAASFSQDKDISKDLKGKIKIETITDISQLSTDNIDKSSNLCNFSAIN